ncbi:unnamed protein product [Closterium sp. Naga37s-1]|nr:unnamed protein product [Closterium sp. Naga37s-1]
MEAWNGDLKGIQRDGVRWRLDRVAKGLERLEKAVARRREAAARTHAPAQVDSSVGVDSVDSWRLPAVRKRRQRRWWGGYTKTSSGFPVLESYDLAGERELVAVRGVVQPACSDGDDGVAAVTGGSAIGAGDGGGATTAGGAAVLGGMAARGGMGWQGDGVTAGAVIVERLDEMVYSELHALLGWRVKSEQVNLFRSEVPFCLAESSDTSAPRVSIPLAKNPSNQHPPIPLVTLHSHLHKALPPTLASAAHLIAGRRMPLGMRTEHRPKRDSRGGTAAAAAAAEGARASGSDLCSGCQRCCRLHVVEVSTGEGGRSYVVSTGVLFALAAAAVAGFMWWRKCRNERREREYEQQH